MRYRFDGFEVDTTDRVVRAAGVVRALQPQAFAMLAYLIEQRGRAVSKRELLERLWPDVVVGESSVQRAISLARAAIDDDAGERIRTIPKLGYRFVAEVEEVHEPAPAAAPEPFRPRFVRSGDVHIAYHTLGEGPVDIVLVPGWAFPLRAFLDHPVPRGVVEELAGMGRVILFDKRGTGLSDRVKQLPSLEERMDDLRAVLDAVGSRSAVLVGFSEGGPLSILFATSFPARVHGLLLVGAFARWTAAPDYPAGWPPDAVLQLRQYIARSWGDGATISAIASSRGGDPGLAAWAARAEQEGASPGAALDLLEMNLRIDVRPVLPVLSAPTVVLHHTRDPVIDVGNGRYIAARVPGARLIELDGQDHVFLFEHREQLREAVSWLARQEAREPSERFLATILVAAVDDDPDPRAAAELAERMRGLPAGPLCWRFDGPQRAVVCGHALAAAWAARGVTARLGVHAGEVGWAGAKLAGDGVDTAAALAAGAGPGEVLASRVVRELVPGSALRFVERGEVLVSLPPARDPETVSERSER